MKEIIISIAMAYLAHKVYIELGDLNNIAFITTFLFGGLTSVIVSD